MIEVEKTPYAVGVVLPVYHQEPTYVLECLQSLEAQTFRNFKLVMVIDGADERTVQAVDTACQQLTISFVIIRRQENKGIAYSLNEGFACLKHCELLTWVSCDNRHYPHFLETLRSRLLGAPPKVVLVYSLFHLINQQGQMVSDKTYRQRLLSSMDVTKDALYKHNFIGPSFMFKTSAFLKAGEYNPSYEKVEDYEFWLRLLQGGDLLFIRDYLMEYRLGGRYAYTTITPREEIALKMAQASVDHRKRSDILPKVSVIISAYNQGCYLEMAVKSVLTQTFDDFQIIVVNDASRISLMFFL